MALAREPESVRKATGAVTRRWTEAQQKLAACPRNDLDEFLACFTFTESCLAQAVTHQQRQ